MKKFGYFFAAVGCVVLIAAGCSAGTDDGQATEELTETEVESEQMTDETAEETAGMNESEPVDVISGSEKVSTSLQNLKDAVETDAEDVIQIQSIGNEIQESWDAIEKEVEAQQPEEYKDIEETLYPLINETQKEQPDVETIKQLTEDTAVKIEAFREK
ncbi:hypothetical protein [Bacillus thermotolerans]|uniref:hypothetical protein n=1 Tax=Bacillus thermotolerans TaxID=1221996 RepID=UPI0005895C47|nr:hypothetical protein [Bacillus thermotolerans]KKB33583.1 Ferrous iron transport periplasmic protein EfeO [Bacillus thermotolerans]